MSKSPRCAPENVFPHVENGENIASVLAHLCATPDDVAHLAHVAAAELNDAFQLCAHDGDMRTLYQDVYDALHHNQSARDLSYVPSDAKLPLTTAFEELAAQPCMNTAVLYEMLLSELQCFVAVRTLSAGAMMCNLLLQRALELDFCGITPELLNTLADIARGYPLDTPSAIDFSCLSFIGVQFSVHGLASLPEPPCFAGCNMQHSRVLGEWTGILRMDAPGANLSYASLGAGCVVGDFSNCVFDGTDISALLHSHAGTRFSLPPAHTQIAPAFAQCTEHTKTLTDWPMGVKRVYGEKLRHVARMNNRELFADLVLQGDS